MPPSVRHRSPIVLLAAALLGVACAGPADRDADDGTNVAEAADVASSSSSEETCRGAGLGTLDEVRRLAPLTDADVVRYLRVMGEAAARRAAPTPEERDALARAEALQQRALTQGLPATAEAAIEANAIMARADTLRRHRDVLVARAQDGGAGCWIVLRDRIEAIVPNSSPDGDSGIYGDESDAPGEAATDAAGQESAEDAELRRRLDALRAADSVVVTPRQAAVAAAIGSVRE
ncbi:hypothetical protein [Roseisolibacter agri]|uniref:Uncharacterized protein n=1 Tax=Roseisolibacter agri TaxID=2014610 RepID=A0AA37QA37_9BACT|nr:hypothetical protein [Roseisolibacter agri]GLC25876.1 hypothetical protein rosag_23890 [Roseisolibacter agri]